MSTGRIFGRWILIIGLNYAFGELARAPFGPHARGDLGEWVRCGMGVMGMAIVVAAVVFTAVEEHRRNLAVRRLRRRPILSDGEFAAMLINPTGLPRAAIANARLLAEAHLGEHGGAWIYPTDRLREDLRLSSMSSRRRDDFCRDLAKRLGIGQDDMEHTIASRTIATFGDLIQAVAESGRLAKLDRAKDAAKPHPLWDRDLDV